MAIETNELIDVKTLPPFKRFIMTIGNLPTSYLESMTYGEMLMWFCNYLQETVIPTVNNNGLAVEELQSLYVELKNYVDNYFENLDVQEEVNIKLDQMAESGQLQELLSNQYVELENEIDEKLDVISQALNDKIEIQDTKIDNAVSGSPLVASSTAGMTDTTRVYVNTTDGKWYYYDGDSWEIGGTYQGTTVSSSDPVITELDARLNQYMNYFYFNETASFNTPFSVKSGQKVYFNITAVTVTTNIYTVDHGTSIYKVLTSGSTGTFELTATSDGAFRFYLTGAGNIQGYCYIENKISNNLDTLNANQYNYIANISSLPDIQLKKTNVLSNFSDLTNHSYANMSTANTTIENVSNYESVSSGALPTPVIRVRDNLGNLLYNITIDNLSSIVSQGATAMWTFGKNGKYLRQQTYAQVKAREHIINSDEYYVILNSYPTTAGYENLHWVVENINIDWLNGEEANTYHVGTGKDFETFTGMLQALQNDTTQKTVYVDPGVYDIFEEMGGADYMAELFDTASTLNWRDVNYIVPENTKIIGIGDVVLKWEATAEQMGSNDVAFLFSPLNVSGNCYIENINVIAQNCRYALHDETSGTAKYDGAKHEFKNCTFTYKTSTYGIKFPYGAGHNKDMTIIFDNCKFIGSAQIMWSTHDWANPADEPSTFIINNCVFDRTDPSQTNGIVRFLTSDTVGRKDKVSINNTYINGSISIATSGTSNVRQGYDLTLIGCNDVDVDYSEYVTTRYDINKYNIIS